MREKVMKLFYAVFALVFGWMFANLVKARSASGSDGLQLVILILCIVAIFLLLYTVIKKLEPVLERSRVFIIASFLVIMGTAQLVFGFYLRYTPMWDLEAIYQGAIDWVETGTFSAWYEYYYWFPNNLGGMSFLHSIFWAANKVGIEDYFAVAMVANCILSLVTMYMTSAVCRKLVGVRGEFLVLCAFAISLPFYFVAPAFYTDALTLLFPISVYYFYLKAKEQTTLSKMILFGALMGLFAVIGMQMKFTVAIMLIAILVDAMFTTDIKRIATVGVTALCMIFVGYGCLNVTIYTNHLDKEHAEKMNTPYLHWVMMGLTGNGGYNPDDYEFTRSFEDTKERDEAIKEVIANRIKERGFGGMIEFLTHKGEVALGAGTYDLDEFLDDSPTKRIGLHSYILGDGENHEKYEYYCLIVLMAIYLLMIVSAVYDVFASKEESWKRIASRVAVFGLLLFLVFWEVKGRYITNFVPVFFVSAMLGVDNICCILNKITGKSLK